MVTNPHKRKVTQVAKRHTHCKTVTVKPQQRQPGYSAGDVCPPPATKTPQSSIPVNTGGSPRLPPVVSCWQWVAMTNRGRHDNGGEDIT